ncbi:ABC transporter ATP-binding protein/permease [Entomoplasma ellychniae]|uniref:ABC transporter ATP-binding protein/permease n=1 Tax=Entomoplasma ellychniae TaxID=2114 RepID=A0A8E2QY78_9MOLU|nr:ABC transporter ATP-binding protein [Entomoplasma ellychniae]PPE04388.1 ABC transporter ATP-binding protein/permease [Entomoplasma ellychniae]
MSKHYKYNANLENVLSNYNKERMGFFKLLYTVGKTNKKVASLVIITIVAQALLVSIVPILTNIVIQQALFDNQSRQSAGQDYGQVWYVWIIIMTLVVILLSSIVFFKDWLFSIITSRLEVKFKIAILRKLFEQDISYYSDKKIGEIMTKVLYDTSNVSNEISGLLNSLIQAPMVLILGTVSLFIISPHLATAALVTVYSMVLILVFVVKNYRKNHLQLRNIMSSINGITADKINSIRLIKSSGTREYENKEIEKIYEPYLKQYKPVALKGAALSTILIASDVIVAMVVVIVAVLISRQDSESFAKLVPITAGLTALTRPLWQVSGIIPAISRASASAEKIYGVMKSKPLFLEHEHDGIIINEDIKRIELKNIVFSYPEQPSKTILQNMNITFEKGKSYAFVGETGAGKTTISKLLLRFYEPSSGEILINGHNLNKLNLPVYLQRVGYVEQEPQIIFGNVFENVKYGAFDKTDSQVIRACKKAKLHELISNMPDGYNTILGERGFILSGGQKQRLIIARMFLKDLEILVMDEATSALDNIVEKEIQVSLNELMVNKTTVVIAHRLSTIKHVDEIIVLGANGAGIVQRGTFENLKKIEGHFKKLYEAGMLE